MLFMMFFSHSKMLKSRIVFVVIFGLSTLTFAQNHEEPSTFWSKVRFGGGIGLSFGNGFFSGTLAPSGIYEFNPNFALGLGLNGTYNSVKNRYNSTILGGSVIGLYSPIQELQVSGEFEQLNVSQNFDDDSFSNRNYWVPALFIGVGYRTNNVTIGIRYDLLYNQGKSVYADPWMPFIRVFF